MTFTDWMQDVFDPKADSPMSNEELRAKRKRYDSFDSDIEIPRICNYVFETHPRSYHVLEGTENAIDHIIYAVRIDIKGQEQEIVVRINVDSHSNDYIFAESALFNAWGRQGISVPKVYRCNLRHEDFDYDFVVLKRVGTSNLEHHLSQFPESAQEWAFRSGDFLAQLHSVEIERMYFGHFLIKDFAGWGTLRGSCNRWEEALMKQYEETVSYLVDSGVAKKSLIYDCDRVLARHTDLLSLKKGVTLHGDYHNGNILVDSNTNAIVAAVDLGQAKSGDPIFDIAFYATYYGDDKSVMNSFLKGYSSVRTLDKTNFDKKMALYDLRINLSKAKLRKRFGYDHRIPDAIAGIERDLEILS